MLRVFFFFLSVSLATVVTAASCPSTGTNLQVLGSGGSRLQDNRASSAYLLWINGKSRLLVNAGNGSSLRFQQSGARFAQLELIALSRLHADYTAGLPGIVSAARDGKRSRALPVFGPEGSKTMPSTVAFIRTLFDQRRGSWREFGSVLSPLGTNGFKLQPHDIRTVIKGGEPKLEKAKKTNPVFNSDEFRLSAAAGMFNKTPVLAWRVETSSGAIVFISNDHNTRLTEFANGAHMLVAPVSIAGANTSRRENSEMADDIGRLAARAGIKHLVLTQRGFPGQQSENAAVQRIKQSFNGKVSLANDLACYPIRNR